VFVTTVAFASVAAACSLTTSLTGSSGGPNGVRVDDVLVTTP
jgi:hypothetical protein